jgi:hypothetical protein
MAELVNLRNFRKRKERAEKESLAGINRSKFGRPKTYRDLTKAEHELAARKLDDHKRDD